VIFSLFAMFYFSFCFVFLAQKNKKVGQKCLFFIVLSKKMVIFAKSDE